MKLKLVSRVEDTAFICIMRATQQSLLRREQSLVGDLDPEEIPGAETWHSCTKYSICEYGAVLASWYSQLLSFRGKREREIPRRVKILIHELSRRGLAGMQTFICLWK
jgi:hypothetical protein